MFFTSQTFYAVFLRSLHIFVAACIGSVVFGTAVPHTIKWVVQRHGWVGSTSDGRTSHGCEAINHSMGIHEGEVVLVAAGAAVLIVEYYILETRNIDGTRRHHGGHKAIGELVVALLIGNVG